MAKKKRLGGLNCGELPGYIFSTWNLDHVSGTVGR